MHWNANVSHAGAGRYARTNHLVTWCGKVSQCVRLLRAEFHHEHLCNMEHMAEAAEVLLLQVRDKNADALDRLQPF